MLFFGILLALEILFRLCRIKDNNERVIEESMTSKEFFERIDKGEELVILDDKVLDIGKFKSHHPGGEFQLK